MIVNRGLSVDSVTKGGSRRHTLHRGRRVEWCMGVDSRHAEGYGFCVSKGASD